MTTVYIALTTEPTPQVIAKSFWRAVAEGHAKQYEHDNRGSGAGGEAHVLKVSIPEGK